MYIIKYKEMYTYNYIHNYIPGTCLSFVLGLKPLKKALFQSKQGSFGFQVYILPTLVVCWQKCGFGVVLLSNSRKLRSLDFLDKDTLSCPPSQYAIVANEGFRFGFWSLKM